MNRKTQAGILLILVVLILVVAAIATLVFVVLPVVAGAKYSFAPAPAAPVQSPEQVTQDFYAWYIGYAGTANPLVDKAYRNNDALTRDFVARLDAFTAQPMMFDPILRAQDVPASISTTATDVSGATATVVPGILPGAWHVAHCRTCQASSQVPGTWLRGEFR